MSLARRALGISPLTLVTNWPANLQKLSILLTEMSFMNRDLRRLIHMSVAG